MRISAVYARQSVDKADSISIESQIDFCKYELKGGAYETYTDKGFSGKNTDRPAFQRMMEDIKAGKIEQVVVYKLDRISRSILDFATMMDEFQKYGVSFVSSTEKFDTSSPMGRAMLNICIVFAQLERETIQKRTLDAYRARSVKGFFMGGRPPRGFKHEPFTINGIHSKRAVPDPKNAALILQAYEMYARPGATYRSVADKLRGQGFEKISSTGVTHLLSNPLYAKADINVYNFFVEQGAHVASTPDAFVGTNGCYLYREGGASDSSHDFSGVTVVIAPSEGLVDSSLWLACRRKMLANLTKPHGQKPKHTWLVGKVRCGNCGGSMKSEHSYFTCRKMRDGRCVGSNTVTRIDDLEREAFKELREKLKALSLPNPDVSPRKSALQLELAKVDQEIDALIASLGGANAVLLSYANQKIEELDERRRRISKDLADLSIHETSPDKCAELERLIANWDSVDFDAKVEIVDAILDHITVKDGVVEYLWRI